MKLKKIQKSIIKNKKILVRIDSDVPLARNKKGEFFVLDDTRLKASLSTINYLIKNGAEKIILVGHLGRPKGVKKPDLSLKPIASHFQKLLKIKKPLKEVVINNFEAFEISSNIILLENIRFWIGEEENRPIFARKLAGLADIFVMDAFATSHRASASIVGVARYLPAYAGINLAKEVEALSKIIESPSKPFVAIMGGAKISDKIEVIENILPKVDFLLVGGGIANTFLAAIGIDILKSTFDVDKLNIAKELLKKYSQKIILPKDVIFADKIENNAKKIIVDISIFVPKIPEGYFYIVDIGPKTVAEFSKIIKKAQTLIWNGPLGVYEIPEFAEGTLKVGKVFAKVCEGKPFGLVGGGDVIASLKNLKIINKIDYISTAGGAMLEFLAGKNLPGLEILKKE